ncbi:MAG: long-chain fatty acid--CoA ligase [Acidobacteriota bacterium]
MISIINDIFMNTTENYLKEDFIKYKKDGKYVNISTEDYKNLVRAVSLGLLSLGLRKGEKVVILSENRPEWIISDMAIILAEGVAVPIYSTLVPTQIQYIIEDSDAKIVFFSDEIQWEKLKKIKHELKQVQYFITFLMSSPWEGIISFDDLMKKGEKLHQENPGLFNEKLKSSNPEDLVTIIYTSGTTGVPKGAMLSHNNFVSNILAIDEILKFSDKDVALSFLPLSHVLERMVSFTYLYKGITVGFAENIEKVGENLLEIKPTVVVSVPRLFEKIYARVMDNVLSSSNLKKKIFFWAINTGKKYSKKILEKPRISFPLKFKYSMANKLVFSKIKEKTGGRIRFFVSGGAPLSKEIGEFFFSMGIKILEGYGLTETSPVISVNREENFKFGTVGPPIPGVEVKIAEDGEILVKGPNVMKGYYKKEAETREAFEGGWFHTGDLGRIDEDGFLIITDRKKDLIITSSGKNIAPQMVENIIKTSPYVSNVVCVGDKRSYISALIVPNFDKLKEVAKDKGFSFSSLSELVKDEYIINFMMGEIDRVCVDLAPFEKVKKIALLERDFLLEENEITPTLKVKRNIIEKKYEDLIDSLYLESH